MDNTDKAKFYSYYGGQNHDRVYYTVDEGKITAHTKIGTLKYIWSWVTKNAGEPDPTAYTAESDPFPISEDTEIMKSHINDWNNPFISSGYCELKSGPLTRIFHVNKNYKNFITLVKGEINATNPAFKNGTELTPPIETPISMPTLKVN